MMGAGRAEVGRRMRVAMATTLTSKGQVTITKHIRDELHLLPGVQVEFSVNAQGEVVIQRHRPVQLRWFVEAAPARRC